MNISTIKHGFGALVTGIDLANVSDKDFESIRHSFLDNGGLLLVKGQKHLRDKPEVVKDFAARFGTLEDNEKYFRMKVAHPFSRAGTLLKLHHTHHFTLC